MHPEAHTALINSIAGAWFIHDRKRLARGLARGLARAWRGSGDSSQFESRLGPAAWTSRTRRVERVEMGVG